MAYRCICGGPVLCILDNVEGVFVVDSWAYDSLAFALSSGEWSRLVNMDVSHYPAQDIGTFGLMRIY